MLQNEDCEGHMSHGCEYIFKSMKFYTNVNALAILFNLYIHKL